MDMRIIKQDWEVLAGKRMQFAHGFYTELLTRHPQYHNMFPESMDTQMQKMVAMLSSIARFADHSHLIRPYLVSVGYAHRRLGIDATDVENFKETFIETLSHLRDGAWDESHDRAWHEALDDMVIPLFDEGLETGCKQQPAHSQQD